MTVLEENKHQCRIHAVLYVCLMGSNPWLLNQKTQPKESSRNKCVNSVNSTGQYVVNELFKRKCSLVVVKNKTKQNKKLPPTR